MRLNERSEAEAAGVVEVGVKAVVEEIVEEMVEEMVVMVVVVVVAGMVTAQSTPPSPQPASCCMTHRSRYDKWSFGMIQPGSDTSALGCNTQLSCHFLSSSRSLLQTWAHSCYGGRWRTDYSCLSGSACSCL